VIVRVETRHGSMFVPDTDLGQYGWLATIGASAEDEFVEEVCALLDERTRGIAVDAGANFGCWALPLSAHATDVLCFEPQPSVLNCLARTTLVNLDRRITIHEVALGERAGHVDVPVLDLDAPTNFGGVTLGISHHEQPGAQMVRVPVATLDSRIRDEDLVSFIKVDVEGQEPAVLRGAARTIARCRPVLFVEVVHRFSDAEALTRQVEDMGYATSPRGPNIMGVPL
jgi:FkbM family methyltransferase